MKVRLQTRQRLAVGAMDVEVLAFAPAGRGDAVRALVVGKGHVAHIGGVQDGVQSAGVVMGVLGNAADTGTVAWWGWQVGGCGHAVLVDSEQLVDAM